MPYPQKNKFCYILSLLFDEDRGVVIHHILSLHDTLILSLSGLIGQSTLFVIARLVRAVYFMDLPVKPEDDLGGWCRKMTGTLPTYILGTLSKSPRQDENPNHQHHVLVGCPKRELQDAVVQ